MNTQAIAVEHLAEPLATRIVRACKSLRITIPFRRRDPAHEKMEEALVRLAETSPHLMDDIGFTEQERRHCERRVWVRGSLRVEGRG